MAYLIPLTLAFASMFVLSAMLSALALAHTSDPAVRNKLQRHGYTYWQRISGWVGLGEGAMALLIMALLQYFGQAQWYWYGMGVLTLLCWWDAVKEYRRFLRARPSVVHMPVLGPQVRTFKGGR